MQYRTQRSQAMTNWTDHQIAECNAGIDRYLNLAIEQMMVLQHTVGFPNAQRWFVIERLIERLPLVQPTRTPAYLDVHNHGLTIWEAE